jgi:hypothetical protein
VAVPDRAEPDRPDKPCCADCGRAWLSDLSYQSRPCPGCGGTVMPPEEGTPS